LGERIVVFREIIEGFAIVIIMIIGSGCLGIKLRETKTPNETTKEIKTYSTATYHAFDFTDHQ
jgi:hypothetical protein